MLARRFRFIIVLCLSALSYGCAKNDGPRVSQVRIVPVTAEPVSCDSSFSYPCTYYGRIVPARKASLSFELAGHLASVFVDEGGRVLEGQVLARLDTSALEADREVLLTKRQVESSVLARLQRGERDEVIAVARAEVKRMQVDVRLTSADRQRAESVFKGRAISKSDYDDAVYAHESAQFALEQAEKRLEELESGSRIEDLQAQQSRVAQIDAELKRLAVQFHKSELKSPFDAVCIRRSQDEGVSLAPGQSVLEISEVMKLEARFSIPQGDLASLKSASELDIDGRTTPVTEFRVIAQVDETVRAVDVVIPISNDEKLTLLPGQTCSLRIQKCIAAECVRLPIAALVPSVRGLWSCYRLRPDEVAEHLFRIEKVEVSIIHTDGEHVVVVSSLKDHDLIVPSGVHRVVPGMSVKIVESEI